MKSEYSEVIIKLRNKLGLTQKEVADRLGITVQTVSNWETGFRVPRLTPKQMLALCKVLQCSLEELAGAE